MKHDMSNSRALPPSTAPSAARLFEAVVAGLVRHGAVTQLTLTPPANAGFTWRPGQYLSLILPDGSRRSFSMASRCQPGGQIELHIRRHSGGRFSDGVLSQLKIGDRLRIDGPYGQIDWRDGDGPIVLLGTGTGLAPLKALIEHALAEGHDRPLHLYWGARSAADLYLSPLLHLWAARRPGFMFIPVLSQPHANWSGRVGHVQDAAAEDFADLDGVHVYACGSPAMIESARRALGGIPGWDEDRFLADAFEPADATSPAPTARSLTLSVAFQGQTRTVPAAEGSSLLAALQAAGAPILSICGGKASCGECKLAIDPAWADRLPAPGRTERRLLANLDPVGPLDRLACQILLTPETDGLAVHLGPKTTALWPA
jgi:CDP-4-dehydro-6-deoxyglucose reductase